MTVQHRQTASRRARALLLSTAMVSGLGAGGQAVAQTLPGGAVQIPQSGGLGDVAKITKFDNGFGLRVDLQDKNRVIDWTSFNVGTQSSAREEVNFTTSSNANLAVLNRVAFGPASSIFGSITSKSNITVWLVNPSGVTFGNTGSFSGGSLVVSTAQTAFGFDSKFIAGDQSLDLTAPALGQGGIVLRAGSGTLAAAGPILLVAQTINAGKTITSSGGDVALVAASDVTVPNAFGSPLGIQITKGTTLGSAKLTASGAISGASVRLYGANAKGNDLDDALLNVTSTGTLTATAVGGKVVIAAGVADGTDMTLSDDANDVGGVAAISHAGRIAFTATDAGSASLLSNDDILGGGSIGTTAREATAVTIAGGGAVTLGDIASRDDFTLATTGNLSLGTVASRLGHVDLSTTVPNARIDTDGLSAATYVRIASADDATVAGAVTAGTDYTVSGRNVTLGTLGASPAQKAAGLVDINATGNLRALGGVALQSNSGGVDDAGDTRAVHLRAGGTIVFDADSTVLGGTSRQSVLGINAGGLVTLGTARARQLGQYAAAAAPVFAEGLAVNGAFSAKLLQIAGNVAVTSAGAMSLGSVTSLSDNIVLKTTAGGIGGFNDGERADLIAGDGTTSTAARQIQVTSAGNALLGTLTAGKGTGGLAALQIDVQAGGTADVARASTADGAMRLLATGGAVTLGSATTAGALSVTAQSAGGAFFDANVTGKVGVGGDYAVRGKTVTLGGDACSTGNCIQTAAGSFVATANGGDLIGKSGYTFQSNNGGVADAGATRAIDLTAKGGAIALANGTTVLGGTDLQSLLVLVLGGEATLATDAPTAITLGTVRARAITGADLGASFTTAAGLTATDLRTADTLDLRATGGSLHIGTAQSRAGNIALSATTGDITGNALVSAPVSAADYGGAALSATTVGATITAQGLATTGTVKLGAVTAGQGTTVSAGDQISISGGTIQAPATLVANNGALRLVSTGGDVVVGAGSSARTDAVVDAFANARIASLTAITGNVGVTAHGGDITGLASVAAPASLADYGRAALTAAASGATVTVQGLATTSNVRLGAVDAGTGTAATAGNQIAISGGAIDVGSAAASNGALQLVTSRGEAVLGAGSSARGNAVVDAFTSARVGGLTSKAGNIAVTARGGDVTGLALVAAPGAITDYGRGTLSANGTDATIAVQTLLTTGNVRLGTLTAGTAGTTSAVVGDQIGVSGGAIDLTSAVAHNGSLRLVSSRGDVTLGAGSSARLGATIDAFANARLGGLSSIADRIDVTARHGDISGLALGAGDADETLLARFGRADLTAATGMTLTASGGVQLGTLTSAAGDLLVNAGSSLTPGDGAIDLAAVDAATGSFALTAYAGDVGAAVYNGRVTLGSGTAGLDGTITARGAIALGTASTTTTTGRDLTLAAGVFNDPLLANSTAAAVTVRGTIAAGTATTGAYRVTGTSVDLGAGTEQASGAVGITAYGTGAGDGLTGANGLTLIANSGDAAAANAMTLRADGGAGIAFGAGSTLLGGGNGQSADIGITDPLGQLTLGTVRARSLQGLDAAHPAFGTLAAPNLVDVTGDVTFAGDVTVLGALAIRSQTGNITTQAITTGAAGDNDRGLNLTALGTGGGQITLFGPVLARGDVALDGHGTIRLGAITADPAAGGAVGAIAITSVAGDVTGLNDVLVPLTGFHTGGLSAGAGGAQVNGVPSNGVIDSIDSAGDVHVTGGDIRIGSATSQGGNISIDASGAVTGLAVAPSGGVSVGNVSATLVAGGLAGTITVKAGGGAGGAHAVNLQSVQAGSDITINADRIAIAQATSNGGTLTLGAGSVLALANGIARTIVISGGGAAGSGGVTSDLDAGLLDTNYGAANLTAKADGGTITVTTGGIAQLGAVTAGTTDSAGTAEQIHIAAGALSAQSLTAHNGAIFASATQAVAGIGSPLYIGTISAANAVTLTKSLGDTTSASDVLRVGRIDAGLAGAFGDVTIASDTNARLGAVSTTAGNITVGAKADLTGLSGTATGGDLLDAAYGAVDLTTLTDGKTIDVTTGGIAQLGTVSAGTTASVGTADQIHIDAGALTAQALVAQNGNIFASATQAVAGIGSPLYVGTITAANAVTLTKTLGDAASASDELRVGRIDAGLAGAGALGNVTIASDTNARLGTVTATGGNINVGAKAAITGLAGGAAVDPLDPAYGAVDLTTVTDGGAIAVTAGGIAQLGTVSAGTAASAGTADQIHIDAGALTAQALVAQNGNIFASASHAVAGIGSPLYVGTISAANAVTLTKTLGDAASASDELHVGRIDAGLAGAGALGNVTIASDTNARLGTVTARGGSVSARAQGDLTGLVLANAGNAGTPPQGSYDLLVIQADKAIALGAGRDLQARTLTAGADIDATAGGTAWIGGDATAQAGHYHVTGGVVTLGSPGGATQSAARDVAIRSTTGAITGGAGLTLVSDSAGSGAAGNYLVLDSAGAITFADGLGSDAISILRAGLAAGGTADIGIRLGAGSTLQLGSVYARTIGSAVAGAPGAAAYTVDATLRTGGAIALRDVHVVGDLAIDNFDAGNLYGVTLDSATSSAGGIALATAGDLQGSVGSPRTNLTAALGIDTQTGGTTLLGTVAAGTGAQLVANGDLDVTTLTTGGDAVLRAGGDLRVDTVTASGDSATAPAAMLANAALVPVRHLAGTAPGTAGDIFAEAGGNITDTAQHDAGDSIAAFTSAHGGVTLRSDATVAGTGLVDVATVTAGGTTSGHRDVSITGRRIVATSAVATGGAVSLSATQTGAAQGDVSVTIGAARALGGVAISAGLGTAATPGADNGSIRVGTITTGTGGAVTLTALDGDVTGLAGSSTGLDAGHGRVAITSGGAVNVATGGLFQAGSVSGGAITVASGDVSQAGAVANNGAIDVGTFAATGALTLTAKAGTASGGYSGDVRIGATAGGQADAAAAATTVGGVTTITAAGVRGDVIVARGLTSAGNATLASTSGNLRIATLATGTGSAATLTALDGDVTGLVGSSTGLDAGHGRAVVTAGGDIAVTTGGLFQAGAVSGGAITIEAGDVSQAGKLANNGAIDVGSFTARGALKLTAKAATASGGYNGDIRIGATGAGQFDPAAAATTVGGTTTLATSGVRGDILVAGALTGAGDVTLASVRNVRLADGGGRAIQSSGGKLAVTAADGAITGLLKAGASGSQTGDYGAAVLATTGAGGITLTADRGTAKLGAVSTSNGAITITAADADFSGTIRAGASGGTSTINIVRGALATGTDLGTLGAGAGGSAQHLALGEAELALLAADTVKIDGLGSDVRIGNLAIASGTGAKALELLGTGTFRLTGTIKDAGAASGRVLQIGGADGDLGSAPLGTVPVAAAIEATVVKGGGGAVVNLPGTTLDLRAKRITFGDATLIDAVDAATAGLDDVAAAQKIEDLYVAQPASRLYTGFGANSEAFLTAKTLAVSYSSYALFQNTGTTAIGGGVVLGDPAASKSIDSLGLLLRSVGDSTTNAFGLFGTINGFVGRTAGLLPVAVIDFADGTGAGRVLRITQSNSRVNGCVIGSPDKGCLVLDVPPPTLNLFDERQLQLFGVADDLTIPFDPPIGTSNEALIGDFTTSGGAATADPDCTAPGDARCPAQGTRP